MKRAATIAFLVAAAAAVEHQNLPVEEAVRAEAAERAWARSRLSDPTRPPRITDCPGQQFIAWRDAGDDWRHACVRTSFTEEISK